jgi:hypothetical protein
MKKKIISLFILLLILTPVVALRAQLDEAAIGITSVEENIALSDTEPIVVITKIINTAMLFLGIIAVVVILIAGFKWMTAAGSDDKVKSAKKILMSGVIGLGIVLGSWGIASWVLKQLLKASSNA